MAKARHPVVLQVVRTRKREAKGATEGANWNGRGRQALLMFEAGDHAYAGWVRISTQETFEAEKGRSNPPSDQRLGL